MPKDIASLAFVSKTATTVTLHVTDEDKKDTQEFSKWVAVNGYDADGVRASATFQGIRWNETNPPDDECDVTMPHGDGATFEAFVVLFPDVHTPRSNIVEF